MKHTLAVALLCAQLFAQTVQVDNAGPISALTIDVTTLALTSATEGSLIVTCDSGTGFSGGKATGDFSPITQRVPFLTDRSTTSVTANFSRARDNVVCRAQLAGEGGGGSTEIGQWSGTLDFANLFDLGCSELTFAASSLTTGTPLVVIPPSALAAGVGVHAWPSAADTAKVQLCNTSGGDVDPASGSFTVMAARGYLAATATIDFASVCAGCTSSSTVTVTGATTAMGALVSPPSGLAAGLSPSARVTSANTVTIYLYNGTDADIDPASGSFTAMVIQ